MEKDKVNEIINFSKNSALSAVESIIIRINEKLRLEVDQPHYKEINNITRRIDTDIQNFYEMHFRREFYNEIIFTGEETEKSGDLSDKNKFIASIDAVDGTDLAVRGFYNWCTAMYFFVYESYILGSVVGTPSSKVGKTSSGKTKNFPSGTIYYTLNNKAYKSEPNLNGEFEETALRISETNKRKKLKEASVCFYGQKAGNFLSVFKAGFIKKLKLLAKEAEDKKKSIPFRLYNFGGNPMMVKLAEGHVDAVIELKGQKLYDVIPGAFIAQKAGAFWGDLSGKIIDDDYLKQHGFLSNPNKKLSYILASSKRLYNEILNCL